MRRLTRPVWMLAQVGAIAWLMWTTGGGGSPRGYILPLPGELVFQFGMAVILVAFATALITNLSDWALRRLMPGRRVGQDRELPGDAERVAGPLRRGELDQPGLRLPAREQ